MPAQAVNDGAAIVILGLANGYTFTVRVATPQKFVRFNVYVTAAVPVGADTVYVLVVAVGKLQAALVVPVADALDKEYDNTVDIDGHKE